jgi:hypothetical protein
MAKSPKTTGEHIVSLYGHIKGLSREINTIKNNHLKHIHQDIDKIHDKLDQRFDSITNWIIYGLGAVALLVITQLLYFLSK